MISPQDGGRGQRDNLGICEKLRRLAEKICEKGYLYV